MKKNQFLVTLCSLMLLLSACAKDNLDPRDAFVGTYSISANYVCSDCFGNFWSNSYTSTIVVSKGDKENELLFTDSYQTNHRVTLSGSSFKIEDFLMSNGSIGTGGGAFDSNAISYNLGFSYGCTVCSEEGRGTK